MHASVVESAVRARAVVAAITVLLFAACSSGSRATVKADDAGTLPSAVQATFTTWARDNTDARGSLTVDYVQTTIDGSVEYASAFGVGNTPVYHLLVKGDYNYV